ncbi:MAG: 50S ribosomal protein L10 [Deltaproteobacteria bacterium]
MTTIVKKIGILYRELVTAELKRRMEASPDVLLINFEKLKSAEVSKLRKALKTVGARMLVAKNSFMRKAFEEARKPEGAAGLLEGPIGMVFVQDDPIAVCRALVDFGKANEALGIRGGFMAQRLVTLDDVKLLARIGSRKAVYQQIAGVLNAPVAKLAQGLNQIAAKLVYALKAVSDKKK